MTLEIVIKTIAILIMLKAVVILIATESIIKITKKWTASKSLVRKLSTLYLVVGMILYLLTYLI